VSQSLTGSVIAGRVCKADGFEGIFCLVYSLKSFKFSRTFGNCKSENEEDDEEEEEDEEEDGSYSGK
jgi:hypothetical protein